MYCAPINRERFEREIQNRCRLAEGEEQSSPSKSDCSSKSSPLTGNFCGRQLVDPMLAIKKIYKSVKDYYMISNLNMNLQIIHLLILIHLFIKSVIHTLFVGRNAERKKFFESIYYPNIAGISSKAFMFDYLFLGCAVFFLSLKVARFWNIINLSLENINEYKDLRVAQLNLAYASTFYLTLKEWVSLFNYLSEHENKYHSNRDIFDDHLRSEESVQHILQTLSEKDAIFYPNPIDFEKCYQDSSLPSANERKTWRKDWHIAYLIDRISVVAMREVIVISTLGSLMIFVVYVVGVCEVIYLTFRTEFPAQYSPSMFELLLAVKAQSLSIIHWIRIIEVILLLSPQLYNMYDAVECAMDVHFVTSRTHKVVKIFQNHLKFARHQNQRIMTQIRQSQQSIFIDDRKVENWQINNSNNSEDLLVLEYSRHIKHDLNLIRYVYDEYLSTRRHHTQFLNIFVICGGICAAYTISALILQPIFAEIWILVSFLMSCTVPIVGLFLYCAKMERTFKYLNQVMCYLIVNGNNVLDLRTTYDLMIMSEQFIQKEDRSMIFAGLYAITLDSVAPFLAFMAPAIWYICRLMA